MRNWLAEWRDAQRQALDRKIFRELFGPEGKLPTEGRTRCSTPPGLDAPTCTHIACNLPWETASPEQIRNDLAEWGKKISEPPKAYVRTPSGLDYEMDGLYRLKDEALFGVSFKVVPGKTEFVELMRQLGVIPNINP